jgi:hypothetical protein
VAIAGTTFLHDGITNRNQGVMVIFAFDRYGGMAFIYSTGNDDYSWN